MRLKTEFQDEDFEKGEVADVSIATMPDGRIIVRAKAKRGGEHTFYYDSLEVLYNDWSDYEEPKEYWYLENNGEVIKTTYEGNLYEEKMQEIGNYFGTREEAKKAVEKLKAWKRLKDKGFKFLGVAGLKSEIYFCADEKYDNAHIMFDEYGTSSDDLKQYNKDLDLLFGGEE